MEWVYAIIILCATSLGATCGMGGGVIIKPLLDAISPYSTFQIGIISGACVLAMATSSLIKHFISHTPIALKTALFLSLGSWAGGLFGNTVYERVSHFAAQTAGPAGDHIVKISQNSLLTLLLAFVLFYMLNLKPQGKCLQVTSPLITILAGLILGLFSTFIDIGGGPINVCILCLVFGMNVKDASVNSLITIFFAQIAKFAKTGTTPGISIQMVFDPSLTGWMLLFFIVVAVCGGLLGTSFHKYFSSQTINVIYCTVLTSVLALTLYNIVNNILLLSN